MSDTKKDWSDTVKTGTRGIALTGYLSLILFAGAFGVWASTAPLSDAAIASGVIAAAGQNQIVQHLEGGIIKDIHVQEGDRVHRGDKLFTMDGTRTRSQVNTLEKQWVSLQARKTRLEAQRDASEAIAFDEQFATTAEELGLGHVLREQSEEFHARLARFESEEIILNQRVAASEEAILGFESQLVAIKEQNEVVQEETARKKDLLGKGLTNRSEYTALLRSGADLVGQIGAVTAQIQQARSQIGEAREQLVRQKSQWIEQALTELNEISARIGEVDEQLDSARDVADRLVVRAPSDGVVIHISQNTPGSVVAPGAELVQLLPTSTELIIEARLSPADIDRVRLHQNANLRFVALNTRTTPEVQGTVIFVSPDRFLDEATREPYFVARMRITDELPEGINRDQIYPGMPVEALISTGDRTFFGYLVKPVLDSFSRAFRER